MRHAGVGRHVSAGLATGLVTVGLVLATGCSGNKKDTACGTLAPGCPKPIVVFSEPVTDPMLATPSSEFVEQANVSTALVQRNWPAMATYHEPQVVNHAPLYFEDPFESVNRSTTGCPEGWTWLDFAAIPYSDGRWLLNQVALPVSMVVNPPWQRMCSDGVPSRPLPDGKVDASPCPQPVPVPLDLQCPEQQAVAASAAEANNPPAPAAEPTWGTPTTQPVQ